MGKDYSLTFDKLKLQSTSSKEPATEARSLNDITIVSTVQVIT